MTRRLLTSGIVLLLILVAVPTALAANNDLDGTFVGCNAEGTEVTLEVDGEQVTVVLTDPDSFDCDTAIAGDPVVNVEGTVVEAGTAFEHPVVARIAEMTQATSTPLTYDEVWAIFREGYTAGACTDDPTTPEDECAGVGETCTDDPATPEDECADVGQTCTDDPATPEDECADVGGACTDDPDTLQDECFTYEGVVGLGRIMMAIRLEEQLENSDWTWPELLAWQLDGNGWGSVMVADKLAGESDLGFDDLMTYREEGGNWGDVHQATRLANEDYDAQQILEMRANGQNWGEIRRELGLSGPPEDHGNPNAQTLNGNNGNHGNNGNNGNGPPEDHGGGPPEGRGNNK